MRLIEKYPGQFYFSSIVELIGTNKYFKDRYNKNIIKDDIGNDYILTEKDLLIIMMKAYENIISFRKPMTEYEINDFINYFHIEKDNRTEINFESLQRNIKWLSELKEDDNKV